MRLWHKDLIQVLPDNQLQCQWKDLIAIVENIKSSKTPGNPMVNKVNHYNKSHFYNYCCMVCNEMFRRGFDVSEEEKTKLFEYVTEEERQVGASIPHSQLFEGWHNDRYLVQCFYNLQEKFDCSEITNQEWERIRNAVEYIVSLRQPIA